MSIPLPGFCGPSYWLEDKYAAIERTVNWYPTVNESQEEPKFKIRLAQCPTNQQFSALPVPVPFNQPCRGLLEYRDLVYGVNGTVAFAMRPDGSMVQLGIVANDY